MRPDYFFIGATSIRNPRVDCRIISTSWIHIDRIVIAWIASRGRNIQRGHRVLLLLESWSTGGIIVFTPRVAYSLRVETHTFAHLCECLRSKSEEKKRKKKWRKKSLKLIYHFLLAKWKWRLKSYCKRNIEKICTLISVILEDEKGRERGIYNIYDIIRAIDITTFSYTWRVIQSEYTSDRIE